MTTALMEPAIRILAAGIGSAAGGPLGGVLGSWLGGPLGQLATKSANKLLEQFGDKATEKLIELSGDFFADKIKSSSKTSSSSALEKVTSDSLRASLLEIRSRLTEPTYSDWFDNWDFRLRLSESPFVLGDLPSEDLIPTDLTQVDSAFDRLFCRSLERLDGEGAAFRNQDLSLKPHFREIPERLCKVLVTDLPPSLRQHFHDLISQPDNDKAWKEAELVYRAREHEILSSVKSDTEYIKQKIEVFLASVAAPRQASSKEPLILSSNSYKEIFGREAEAEQLLSALRREGPSIITIATPPGFGKSAVFTRAIQLAFPSRDLSGTGIEGVAVLDAKRQVPTLSQLSLLIGRVTGFKEAADSFVSAAQSMPNHSNPQLVSGFFDLLRKSGSLWIVIENAEAALGDALLPEFNATVSGWCQHDHRSKLLLLTRRAIDPPVPCNRRLSQVEEALLRGLGDASAIALLKRNLESTRFAETSDALLNDIAARLHRVPLALEQFAGYLKAREALITLNRDFVDKNDLLRLFDPKQMEPFLLRIISEQLDLLDPSSTRVLRVVAWANMPIPQEGLLGMERSDGSMSRQSVLTSLVRSNLLSLSSDFPAGASSFSMHPLIREAVQEAAKDSENSRFDLEQVVRKFFETAEVYKNKSQFSPSLDLFTLAERGARTLVEDKGRKDLAYGWASSVMNRGNALLSLDRASEAIEAFDQAVSLFRRLVTEGHPEWMGGLAQAIMNRANALQLVGRVAEAELQYRDAIEIFASQSDLSTMAKTLVNHGNALARLRRFKEAGDAYIRAGEIYSFLIEKRGRHDLVHDLAVTYANLGTAMVRLGRPREAISAFDPAAAIYIQLVLEQKQYEFADGFASVLLNLGNAFADLGELSNAKDSYDRAIDIYRSLVGEEGRHELFSELAIAYFGVSRVLDRQGDIAQSLAATQEARKIWSELVDGGKTHHKASLSRSGEQESRLMAELAAVFEEEFHPEHGRFPDSAVRQKVYGEVQAVVDNTTSTYEVISSLLPEDRFIPYTRAEVLEHFTNAIMANCLSSKQPKSE